MDIRFSMFKRAIKAIPKDMAKSNMTQAILRKLKQRQFKDVKEGKFEPETSKAAYLDEFKKDTEFMEVLESIGIDEAYIISLIDDACANPLDKEDEPTGSLNPGVGRNDPCPCGSGKKFKRCCGK